MAGKRDDDESVDSGEDIPFHSKKKDEEQEQEDEEEGEEEEYAVDKIVSHKFFGKKNKLKYTVKWVGYEETTEEPEENLDNCPDELETYFKAIGGKPQPPSTSGSSRKRTVSETGTPTSRGRLSVGNNKKSKTESNGNTIRDTDDTSTWKVPAGSWEDRIIAIDCMSRGDDGENWGYIVWDNNKKSRHPTKVLHAKCPQKMLQFYESHLFFTPVNEEQAPMNKAVASAGTPKGKREVISPPKDVADDEDVEMDDVKAVASTA